MKLNLQAAVNATTRFVKQNSRTMMTAGGLIFLGLSNYFTFKGTLKAKEILDKAREEEKAKDENFKDFDNLQKIEKVWKNYILTATFIACGGACILGANFEATEQIATLAAAYKLSENAKDELEKKAKEVVGEKKFEEIRGMVAQDEVKANPVIQERVIMTGKGNTLCYDPHSGRYFRTDIEKLKRAINDADHELLSDPGNILTQNDFYTYIGLGDVQDGDCFGWDISQGQRLTVEFASTLTDDDEPCLVLHYQKYILPKGLGSYRYSRY